MLKNRPTREQLINGLREGNKLILSRAISLSESTKAQDRMLISEVLESFPKAENSLRIGISGPPGAGKSTFIESIGQFFTTSHKTAVLSVDPSSPLSGGSILGDKTRMESLSRNNSVYIRPVSAGKHLGGLSQSSYESVLLAEAAGFEIILIETVGVGQSETEVSNLADIFLLLVHAGAGDELQAIKRGIMEMPDAIVITKTDQGEEKYTNKFISEIKHALHLTGKDSTSVFPVSSLNLTGIEELSKWILRFNTSEHQKEKAVKRQLQSKNIFYTKLKNELWSQIVSDASIALELPDLAEKFDSGVSIEVITRKLLKTFKEK